MVLTSMAVNLAVPVVAISPAIPAIRITPPSMCMAA